MNTNRFRWLLIIVIAATLGGLFAYQVKHFSIDTDIVKNLPQNDPVLIDARHVIQNLPIQDRVIINVGHVKADKDLLVEGAVYIEKALEKSGLFKSVGMAELQEQIPGLLLHISQNLPLLFTEQELEEKIKPLLSMDHIQSSLAAAIEQLQSLEGIGRGAFITHDPLGFSNSLMAKLSGLMPAAGASIYRGKLFSADEKNLLLVAELKTSGTDTKSAAAIRTALDQISREVNSAFETGGERFTLTPVGAYRAALDNEEITKRDTEKAVTISTIVIALLLFFGFPRPLIGLLALLPSMLGTMLAFIIYSLMHPSVSILAIGFGGAIISFTVDYGITYLLFLDRPFATKGMEATREVWSLGLLAMLTTALSFAFLFISGFPALADIGEFSALGVVFTYICVHAFFPLVFPTLGPAKRQGLLPLHGLIHRLISSKGKYRFYAASAFGIVMLLFAKPEFHIDLNAMNTVSPETLAAEQQVKAIWGDIFNRIYLLMEGDSMEELQQKGDQLAALLDQDAKSNRLAPAFIPSLLFPGPQGIERNFIAWKNFWNQERMEDLRKNMRAAAVQSGFQPNAFDGFLSLLQAPRPQVLTIPQGLHSLLGISPSSEKGGFRQFTMLSIGPAYDAGEFYTRYSQTGLTRVFDPALFAKKLGHTFMTGFIKMGLLVGLITILVAWIYLFDLRLTAIAVLPTVFALVCTFGTLNLAGVPLGIPFIMVTVVVIGMGTDYALYLVRAYQRYLDEDHPSLRLVHMSVFLSFATTFAGFGVLALSDHALLKNAGLCLALGIGYSFIGAVFIVPSLLRRLFAPIPADKIIHLPGSPLHRKAVMARYRHLEAPARLSARWRCRHDSLFPRLADFIQSPQTILDIGCGYGTPAAWLQALYPGIRIYALEKNPQKAAAAAQVLGPTCKVEIGVAPALPDISENLDLVLMLDVIHYLSDADLYLTLQSLQKKIKEDGFVLVRTDFPGSSGLSWKHRLESLRWALEGLGRPIYRSGERLTAMAAEAGFKVDFVESCAVGSTKFWMVLKISQ